MEMVGLDPDRWMSLSAGPELLFTAQWGLLADETKPFGRIAFNVGCGLVTGSGSSAMEYPGDGELKDEAWKHGFRYGLVIKKLWGGPDAR